MDHSKPLVINEQVIEPSDPLIQQPPSISKDTDIPSTFRSLLRYPLYLRYLIYSKILFIAFYQQASFLSGYGAAYFAGCHSIEQNNNCPYTYNYDKYNLYYQLASSVRGLFAFLSAPIVGGLSDQYGRKPFLILQLVTYSIPYIFMSFYNDMLIFILLSTMFGLNGSTLIQTPVTQAYIADVLPQKLHIIGFGLTYLLSGLGLIIGEIIGYSVSALLNDHFNFYVISGLYAFCALFLFIGIPESKREHQTKECVGEHPAKVCNFEEPEKSQKLQSVEQLRNDGNPRSVQQHDDPQTSCSHCSSLKLCCSNPIVFWCSLLCGLVTLPAIGMIDIATIVLADTFNAESSDSYNRIAMYYIGGWGIGLMAGPVVVLPILKRYTDDFGVFVASTSALAMAMIAFMAICIFKVETTIPVVSCLLGIGFQCFAPLGSILTKYSNPEESGKSFGLMSASGAVMNIIAPFGFAVVYHYSQRFHIPGLIFGVALLMLLGALITSIGLRNAIQRIESAKRTDSPISRLAQGNIL